MRHLSMAACISMMTWSVATGPETPLPIMRNAKIATSNLLGESLEKVTADTALDYQTVVLPPAPLHPLLKPIIPRSPEEICSTLAEAVQSNDLPAPFFIRLLYQESGFRSGVISSAGALGIAQFMPETAADRGLDNPFDPLQAIPASARLLKDLNRKFGNLGLAAAAYNAGPRRIADWLAKKGPLPEETQHYVKAVTGWPVDRWTGAQAVRPAVKLPQDAPCQEIAGLVVWNEPDDIPLPTRNPRAKDSSGLVGLGRWRTDDKVSDQRLAASGLKSKQPQEPHSISTLSAMRGPCAAQDRTSATHAIKVAHNIRARSRRCSLK